MSFDAEFSFLKFSNYRNKKNKAISNKLEPKYKLKLINQKSDKKYKNISILMNIGGIWNNLGKNFRKFHFL